MRRMVLRLVPGRFRRNWTSYSERERPAETIWCGTEEIFKAIRLSAALGVQDVVTTEGDPKTDWGHNLSEAERVFIVAEKLHEPIRLADALGVRILLEPHGILTDSIDGIQAIMEELGNPELRK